MRSRVVLSVLALSALVLTARPSAAQQVVAQRACRGDYGGTALEGTLVLERWMSARSFRYYGMFQDPHGNVYEMEVMTPDLAGGTGSTWLNGARHRETYLTLQVFENGFVVRTEDGVVVQYQCQSPGTGSALGP